MECSNLYELIRFLERGTNLHIGVLFFKNCGNEKCLMPEDHKIHSRPICTEIKKRGTAEYKRCFACRNRAIQKAQTVKKPFGGLCVNGIYEYTHPVVIEDEVVCMIFVGNILQTGESLRNPEQKVGKELLATLEQNFTEKDCEALTNVVESYIRLLLERYGNDHKKESLLLQSVKEYLEENLENEITVELLCKVFHYNRQYLGRLFKKETGKTVKEYILQRRMERAKRALRQEKTAVIEIAADVGFNNVTYFNRRFKAMFHMTPTEYRRTHKKK